MCQINAINPNIINNANGNNNNVVVNQNYIENHIIIAVKYVINISVGKMYCIAILKNETHKKLSQIYANNPNIINNNGNNNNNKFVINQNYIKNYCYGTVLPNAIR